MNKKIPRDELESRVKQLEKEIDRQNRFQGISYTLFSISKAVNTASNLNELYGLIHAALSKIIDTTNFYIALYDKTRRTVSFPYFVDSMDDCYPDVLDISNTESLTAAVIQMGLPLIITKDEILKQQQKTEKSIPDCTMARIWLGVPLKIQDDIIGVMTVQSYIDENTYDHTDMEVMASVADQVALAIERKKSEQILQDSEKRYRSLISQMQNGFALHELIYNKKGVPCNYRFLEVNDAFEKLTGLKKDKLVGKTILDIASENSNAWIDKYAGVVTTGNPIKFNQYTSELDKTFEVLAYTPQKNQFATVFTDISKRKRIEDIQAAQVRLIDYSANHTIKELLRKFLDEAETLTRSEIGFYHFLQADQETLDLQTWSTNTIANMCSSQGSGSHYPVSQAGVWVDCIQKRKAVIHNDYEALAHKKGLPKGHAPVIRELVVPVFRDDQIVAILGVGNKKRNYDHEDVEIVEHMANLAWETVDRKRAEEALLENEKKYRTLFESSIDALSILDVSTGQFIDCNQAAVALHGTGTRDKFINSTPGELSPEFQPNGESSQKLSQEYLRSAFEKGSNVFEWVHARPDGTMFPALVSLSAMEIGGEKFVLAIGRDLTEIKRQEEKKDHLIDELKIALSEVKNLSGLLPICSSCKKIRDDKGYWKQIETYISEHSEADFSHSICPNCARELYPDLDIYDE